MEGGVGAGLLVTRGAGLTDGPGVGGGVKGGARVAAAGDD